MARRGGGSKITEPVAPSPSETVPLAPDEPAPEPAIQGPIPEIAPDTSTEAVRQRWQQPEPAPSEPELRASETTVRGIAVDPYSQTVEEVQVPITVDGYGIDDIGHFMGADVAHDLDLEYDPDELLVVDGAAQDFGTTQALWGWREAPPPSEPLTPEAMVNSAVERLVYGYPNPIEAPIGGHGVIVGRDPNNGALRDSQLSLDDARGAVRFPPMAMAAMAAPAPHAPAGGGRGGLPPLPPGAGGPASPGGGPPGGGGFSLARAWPQFMRNWVSAAHGWWSPIERLPDVRDYRLIRYRALGKKASADRMARDIYDRLSAATDADKRAAYAYLTDAAGDPTTISDPATRNLALQVKALFNRIGDDLVHYGLLPQESVDNYRDRYLPRVYLKHLVGEKERLGGLVSGETARPSDMGYLKRRKDLDDETRAMLGEVLDPGFLAARGTARTFRDLAIIHLLEEISQNEDWVFRDALVNFDGRASSPAYLMAEAESLDTRATFEPDAAKARAMRDRAIAMRQAAQPALAAASGRVPSDYSQIPDTARYGMLRGMWVRKEIVNDLLPGFSILPEDASTLEKLFGQGGTVTKAMRLWKAAKVPLNPATQIRNVLSNAIMLNLSGMPPMRGVLRYMVKAVREIAKDGEMYRFAKSMGLQSSGFSEAELVTITREFLDLERTQWRNRPLAPVTVPAIFFKQLLQKGLAKAGDLYQFFEATMKLAKMMHEVERNGLSREDAYLEAQKWLFDYSEVPATVRYLRNAPIGAPFITYQYKALPLILEVAATKPWRLAPYVALPFAMAMLFAAMYDVDDDDVEKLRKALPEWMRKKQNSLVLPYKDEAGRWQFFDFGYLIPWSAWQEAAGELAEGHPIRAMREMGVGGPVADLGAVLLTNIDPFTQRPIADPRDPPEVRAMAITSYAWRVAMPPWMTDQSFARRMWESYHQTPSGYYGEPPLTMPQAAMRGVGLNVYPVDPERTRETNITFMRRAIEDARNRMKSRLNDRRLDAEARERLRATYQADIDQRTKDLEDYETNSVINPALGVGLPGVGQPGADPEETREANIKSMRRGIEGTRRWMRARLKDQRLDDADRERLREHYDQEIERRRRALDEYLSRPQ